MRSINRSKPPAWGSLGKIRYLISVTRRGSASHVAAYKRLYVQTAVSHFFSCIICRVCAEERSLLSECHLRNYSISQSLHVCIHGRAAAVTRACSDTLLWILTSDSSVMFLLFELLRSDLGRHGLAGWRAPSVLRHAKYSSLHQEEDKLGGRQREGGGVNTEYPRLQLESQARLGIFVFF